MAQNVRFRLFILCWKLKMREKPIFLFVSAHWATRRVWVWHQHPPPSPPTHTELQLERKKWKYKHRAVGRRHPSGIWVSGSVPSKANFSAAMLGHEPTSLPFCLILCHLQPECKLKQLRWFLSPGRDLVSYRRYAEYKQICFSLGP